MTFFLCGPRICLAQNKYDVLAKVLQPYGSLFYSKSVNKAMVAEVTIRQASKITPLLLNRRIRISFQFPDKLRIETNDPDERVILCRNGQSVWVYPKNLGEQLGAAGSTGGRPDRGKPSPTSACQFEINRSSFCPLYFRFSVTNRLRIEPISRPGTWSLGSTRN